MTEQETKKVIPPFPPPPPPPRQAYFNVFKIAHIE